MKPKKHFQFQLSHLLFVVSLFATGIAAFGPFSIWFTLLISLMWYQRLYLEWDWADVVRFVIPPLLFVGYLAWMFFTQNLPSRIEYYRFAPRYSFWIGSSLYASLALTPTFLQNGTFLKK